MKTKNEILTSIVQTVKDMYFYDETFNIYKTTRPTDSESEDFVVSLISGFNAKFLQDGAIYCKWFYDDIFQDNTYMEDTLKGDVLEKNLFDLSSKLLKLPGYSFDIESRETYTESVLDLNQHFAILKINFKTLI